VRTGQRVLDESYRCLQLLLVQRHALELFLWKTPERMSGLTRFRILSQATAYHDVFLDRSHRRLDIDFDCQRLALQLPLRIVRVFRYLHKQPNVALCTPTECTVVSVDPATEGEQNKEAYRMKRRKLVLGQE
jgi:hypothetical protein